MILADTSVWADFMRSGDDRLQMLLAQGQIAIHPFVIGEIALGSIRNRDKVIKSLVELRQVTPASNEEVMLMVDNHRLFGRGIGYVDAHLLASCFLSTVSLWTRDKRLSAVATDLGIADRLN